MLGKQGGGEEWSVATTNGNYWWVRMTTSEAICPRHGRCPTSMFGGGFLHERSRLLSSWPGGTEWMGRELRARVQELSSWQRCPPDALLPCLLIRPPVSHPSCRVTSLLPHLLMPSSHVSSSRISSLLPATCWLVLGGGRGDLSLLQEAWGAFLGQTGAL